MALMSSELRFIAFKIQIFGLYVISVKLTQMLIELFYNTNIKL